MAFAMAACTSISCEATNKTATRTQRLIIPRLAARPDCAPHTSTLQVSKKEQAPPKLQQKFLGALLAASLTVLPVGQGLASVYSNEYTGAINELEEVLPLAEESLSKIAAKAGAEEVKEIVAELKEIQTSVAKLERAEEILGGEATSEIEAEAKPLLEQLTQLKNLLGLFN